MLTKHQRNFLLISISVLILVLISYRYFKTLPASEPEEGKVTVATFIKEKTHEVSESISNKITEIKLKREAKKEEKKRAEAVADIDEDFIPTVDTIENDAPIFEGDLETDVGYTVYTTSDGKRYIATYKTAEGEAGSTVIHNEIPESVGDITFRAVEGRVYAAKAAKLYTNPQFEGGAVMTAGRWEEFTRVGISSDCCYQLVTKSGEIVYGDGLYFRRYREDMDLTENINLREERVTLEVKFVSQNPSLPTGCEITSLATVLQYLGFNVTKEALSDNYLPKKPAGEANFYEEFVGNPRNASSYGCYAGAIVNAANNYLSEQGTDVRAIDYSGCLFSDVLWRVREGKPVIVWVTTPITVDPGYTTEWIVDGEYLVWKGNLHCVVVTGYDTIKNTVIVSDPLIGIKEYDMELFVKRFKQFYSQAVVID